MIHCAIDRFPEQRDAIEQRLAQDSAFFELCEDYAEASQAWAYWRASVDGASPADSAAEIAENYRTLLRELEEEILQALQPDQNRSSGSPPNGDFGAA